MMMHDDDSDDSTIRDSESSQIVNGVAGQELESRGLLYPGKLLRSMASSKGVPIKIKS